MRQDVLLMAPENASLLIVVVSFARCIKMDKQLFCINLNQLHNILYDVWFLFTLQSLNWISLSPPADGCMVGITFILRK